MTPRLQRVLLITVVVAMAALSQIAIIVPIGAADHVALWIPSAVAVCLFAVVPSTRDGALVIPWAVGVGCLTPGIAALGDGSRVLFVGMSGLLMWLTTEVAVLARAELTGAGTAGTRATGALDARLEALLLVALVALAAMFAAVLVALTDVGGGVMVALLALAAAGAYRTASTRLR